MREDVQRSLQQIFYEHLSVLEQTVDEMEPLLEDFLGVIGVGADGELQQVTMDLQGQPQPGIRIIGAIGGDEYEFTATFTVNPDQTITVHLEDGDEDDQDGFEIIRAPELYTILQENHLIPGAEGGDHVMMAEAEDMQPFGAGEEVDVVAAVVPAAGNNYGAGDDEMDVDAVVQNIILGDGADDDEDMEGSAVDPYQDECFDLQLFFYNAIRSAIADDPQAENAHIAQNFLGAIGHNGVFFPNIRLEVEAPNTIRIRPVGDNNPYHDFTIAVDDEYAYIGFALRYRGGGIEDAFEFHEEEGDIGDALEVLRQYTGAPEYNINIDDDGAECLLDIQPNVDVQNHINPGAFVEVVGGCSGFSIG